MAKVTYIGANDKAKKVKNIYIGVNDVAKKVIKAYIGVDNKAKLVYSIEKEPTYIEFTSCPFPTTWDSNTNSGTNKYGTWTVSGGTNPINSVDGGNQNTANSSTVAAESLFVTITLPENILICPSDVTCCCSEIDKTKCMLYGYNSDTEAWEAIAQITTGATYDNKWVATSLINTDKYYTAFQLECVPNSENNVVNWDFQIRKGTIKQLS